MNGCGLAQVHGVDGRLAADADAAFGAAGAGVAVGEFLDAAAAIADDIRLWSGGEIARIAFAESRGEGCEALGTVGP
ncbi:hypothetical protein [Oligosphaera ethanolica]|uniref:Uncharacterized protein n=1 Tax=Oligosphaera ethanolica TaxID=760260 RepID=A0AAE3VHL8_9BACT|nr:hypothetical protein [Oligosphaera ethanolica]MDQ0290767.1 hypothetical protein [Oligosphaera ethanolica]